MTAHESLSPDQFETFYHLTDKANFKPSARKVPQDNALSIHARTRPGLFVTHSPESWVNGHGYIRPFVAEVKVPRGVAQAERWGGEKFIPAEHLAQAHVSRVIPLDAHAREKYGDHGWIEEHHGSTFDTHEPIAPRRGNSTPHPGYTYDGPDVRDMDKATIAEHKSRARAFRRAQGHR